MIMETASPFKEIQDLQDQQREGWMPESDTPETDATRKDVMAGRWSLVEKGGFLEKLEKLERERNEARQQVAELTQRLQERQESFQTQLIRIEDTWREKLSKYRVELQETNKLLAWTEKQLNDFTSA